jgi:hypothetical protein
MKEYSIIFFFPSQSGFRQEKSVQVNAGSLGVAVARAWKTVRHDPNYKGRRGLDNARIGVSLVRNGGNVGPAEAASTPTGL